MEDDDVIKRVRAAREAFARKHNYNVHAMVAELQALNAAGDWPVVSPRRPAPPADARPAADPPLIPPDLPTDAAPRPVEAFLEGPRKPLAVAGVVENGVVRPLDPGVTLPERSRVIIVAAGAG